MSNFHFQGRVIKINTFKKHAEIYIRIAYDVLFSSSPKLFVFNEKLIEQAKTLKPGDEIVADGTIQFSKPLTDYSWPLKFVPRKIEKIAPAEQKVLRSKDAYYRSLNNFNLNCRLMAITGKRDDPRFTLSVLSSNRKDRTFIEFSAPVITNDIQSVVSSVFPGEMVTVSGSVFTLDERTKESYGLGIQFAKPFEAKKK